MANVKKYLYLLYACDLMYMMMLHYKRETEARGTKWVVPGAGRTCAHFQLSPDPLSFAPAACVGNDISLACGYHLYVNA